METLTFSTRSDSIPPAEIAKWIEQTPSALTEFLRWIRVNPAQSVANDTRAGVSAAHWKNGCWEMDQTTVGMKSQHTTAYISVYGVAVWVIDTHLDRLTEDWEMVDELLREALQLQPTYQLPFLGPPSLLFPEGDGKNETSCPEYKLLTWGEDILNGMAKVALNGVDGERLCQITYVWQQVE